ncbi:DUF4064 domain-containing protein [Mammaliicoccus stepanovicii]|uniref:Membrane protein n=1 Tax=Mammaliicoccus stepanovicii TaxID=643214 RepID=A0A239ZNL2_9STAP|nr:DUF4064 domain-containing protein [Mammaliicoccus stepanovicii]PNZ79194.1 hypothetical protein CD111_00640 [Mammaliicoccus stepanovicii]GGI41459.1 hypothetical protein GCM10010896_13540 [Mammaliicoccus stepanovicii]SNV72539.1 membrane protein [Mammaliicoccus stepanovicii]
MSSYVEHVKQPVGRGFEKFFGWLAWIIVLGVTVLSLFAALVLLNNPTNLNKLETLIDQLKINVQSNGQFLSSAEIALNIQNGIWLFIIYLIIVLIFAFIGLVLIRWRIFSALLFLILAIVTLPLVIVLVPLLFFIVSILLFVRKDKVLPIQDRAHPRQHFDEREAYNEQVRPLPRQPQYRNNEENEFSHKEEVPEESNTNDSIEQTETANHEILSRSKKHQKQHKPQKQEEITEEEVNESDDLNYGEQDNIGQRQESPYNYQTTQADDYQVQTEKQKRKKEKKEKPNATIERRKNYEKRMKQQNKYFEDEEKYLEEKVKKEEE